MARVKSVLKLRGIEKWAYLIKTRHGKIKSDVRREYEKSLIEYMAQACVEKGVIAAISAINDKDILYPLETVDKPLTEFLKQYFEKTITVSEKLAQNDEDSKKKSKRVIMKYLGYFLLHQNSSKRIVQLIKNNDNLLADRFLDVLVDYKLRRLCERNGVNFSNLRPKESWWAREKTKLIRELSFVNSSLKGLLRMQKFSPGVKAKIV